MTSDSDAPNVTTSKLYIISKFCFEFIDMKKNGVLAFKVPTGIQMSTVALYLKVTVGKCAIHNLTTRCH